MGISINGLSFVIDKAPEKMHPMFRYTGRADPEKIGRIDFFPKAFLNLEELTRTLFHKKIHVEQFKRHGPEYVQNNRKRFEKEAEKLENEFIEKLRKEGKL